MGPAWKCCGWGCRLVTLLCCAAGMGPGKAYPCWLMAAPLQLQEAAAPLLSSWGLVCHAKRCAPALPCLPAGPRSVGLVAPALLVVGAEGLPLVLQTVVPRIGTMPAAAD